MGWELFENYLIAKEKFKPDFFLYENNKSAAQAIKDEIKKRLEVWDGTLLMPDSGARYIEINSALVSAQNRQRFYVHNCGEVGQPADRGILLKDILETGIGLNNKSYCLDANYYKGGNFSDLTRQSGTRLQVAEPIGILANGKSRTIKAQYCHNNLTNFLNANYGASGVAIPINDIDGKSKSIRATCYKDTTRNLVANNYDKRTCVAEPVRIGDIGSTAQAHRVYSCNGKSVTINAGGDGQGAKTGLYACPFEVEELAEDYYHGDKNTNLFGKIISKNTSNNNGQPAQCVRVYNTANKSICLDGDGRKYIIDSCPNNVEKVKGINNKIVPVYEVHNGKITVKGKQYPIKLDDGFYIIRKLTVTECCRLQTMPDFYMSARIEKVKEIVLKCKDVPTQIVAIPLRTEKRGCAINTTFDLKEMEVQNLKDQKLTPHCLALSRDVIDIDKHIWDIVLCIIKDLQEKGQHDYFEAIMNMCRVMMSADLSIEKLPKECLDENLKREKSSTILTLIQKIIAKITSMFVPQKNTLVCIENCAESCLSASPTSLTLGILYSTEKNMRLVSETACYKGLGNGWTAEVIIHILSNALKDIPKDEEIVVLSMYDGIGTGRYCLDKMGFTNVKYYAYEIDKFAMRVAMSNYPDIVQCGDAFQVRQPDWKLN